MFLWFPHFYLELLEWETYFAVRWGPWKYFNYKQAAPTYRCSESFNTTMMDFQSDKWPELYMEKAEEMALNITSDQKKMNLKSGEQLYNLDEDPFEINNFFDHFPVNRTSLLKTMNQYVKTEVSKGQKLPHVANCHGAKFFLEIKSFISSYYEQPEDYLIDTDRVVQDVPNYFASVGQNWCSVETKFRAEVNFLHVNQTIDNSTMLWTDLENDKAIIERLQDKASERKDWNGVRLIKKTLKYSPLFTNNHTPSKLHFKYVDGPNPNDISDFGQRTSTVDNPYNFWLPYMSPEAIYRRSIGIYNRIKYINLPENYGFNPWL